MERRAQIEEEILVGLANGGDEVIRRAVAKRDQEGFKNELDQLECMRWRKHVILGYWLGGGGERTVEESTDLSSFNSRKCASRRS